MKLRIGDCALPMAGELNDVILKEGYVTANSNQPLNTALANAERSGFNFIVVDDPGTPNTFVSIESIVGIAKSTPGLFGSKPSALLRQIESDIDIQEHFRRSWELFRAPILRGNLFWCDAGRHLVSLKPCPEHG